MKHLKSLGATSSGGGRFKARFAKPAQDQKPAQSTVSANALVAIARFCLIILLLVFFAPVGLWLMWRYGSWSTKSKKIISIVAGLWFLLMVIGVVNAPPTVTLSAPRNHGETVKTDESKYTIRGEVSSIYSATLTINGDAVPVKYSKFNYAVSLHEGENKIRVVATNKNGRDKVEFTIYRIAKADKNNDKAKKEKVDQAEAEKAAAAKAEADKQAAAAKAEADRQAAAAKEQADRQAAEEAAQAQAQAQAQQQSSNESSARERSPNSGVTYTVSGYCNDGLYVTGNPSARGKANACYGHKGWRDY